MPKELKAWEEHSRCKNCGGKGYIEKDHAFSGSCPDDVCPECLGEGVLSTDLCYEGNPYCKLCYPERYEKYGGLTR